MLDMSGGAKGAKRPLECPLDEAVRPQSSAARFHRVSGTALPAQTSYFFRYPSHGSLSGRPGVLAHGIGRAFDKPSRGVKKHPEPTNSFDLHAESWPR